MPLTSGGRGRAPGERFTPQGTHQILARATPKPEFGIVCLYHLWLLLLFGLAKVSILYPTFAAARLKRTYGRGTIGRNKAGAMMPEPLGKQC